MTKLFAIFLAGVIILMAGPSPGVYKPGDQKCSIQAFHFDKSDMKKGSDFSCYAEAALMIDAPPVYKKENDAVKKENGLKPGVELRNKGPSIETLRTQLILLIS